MAWKYLALDAKSQFKKQARSINHKLLAIKAAGNVEVAPAYVVADADPVTNRGVQTLEREILFNPKGVSEDGYALIHNDLSKSNLIVSGGRIKAVVDWEMAGFFNLGGCGWRSSSHSQSSDKDIRPFRPD